MNWEIIQKSLEFTAEEMGIILKRSSFSPNIRERNDFSCGIIDPNGRILAQAEHIPVHLGSFKIMARNCSDYFNELEEGDVLLFNDPYISGTHLNDLAIVTPIFYNSKMVALTVNKAHHVDVGGPYPASINPNARTLFEEGLVIPPVKIMKKGEIVKEVMEIIKSNFKTPKAAIADLNAQISANLNGMKKVKELINRKGLNNFQEACEEAIKYSKRITIRTLSVYKGKRCEAEDYLELDDSLLTIKASIQIEDKFLVDFKGSSKQIDRPLNAVFGVTFSAVSFALRCIIREYLPINEGFYEVIEAKAEIGSILNPIKPAPVSAGNLETSQRIVDTIFKALAEIMPERITAASCGTMMNVMLGGIRNGEFWSYYETIGGGSGGRPNKNGVSAVHVNMTNTLNTPIEVAEKEYPVLFTIYKIRIKSGGDGKFKGGDGIIRAFKMLDKATLSIISDRFKIPPWGIQGGNNGETGKITIIKKGNAQVYPSKFSIEVEKNDEIIIETPGGGGYGRIEI